MSLIEVTTGPAPDTWENPGDLRMFSYVPDNLPGKSPNGAPLVVLLHGCGQSAEALAIGAGWLTLADTHGFALLCPEQKRGNNFNTCFNWFQPEDVRRDSGEAHSIAQMTLLMLGAHTSLDPARVFVTGLSAGGAMTNVMLAAYPELYAAGAVIAGLPYAAARNLPEALGAMGRGAVRTPEDLADAVRTAVDHRARWPKVSVWHGDSDTVVSPANAGAIIRQWADAQGISAAPPMTETFGARERRVWTDLDGEVALELNIITGLNHAWALATAGADSCGAPGPYLIDANVSTSAEILRFWGIHKEQKQLTLKADILIEATATRAPRAAKPALPNAEPAALPAPAMPQTLLDQSAAVPAARPRRRSLAARIGGGVLSLLGKLFRKPK